MRIYDDHIELWNDGELPEGYTQETLFQKRSSKPRNKNIATAFFKAGYVEAWGRGYKKIREALESAKLPFPKVENFCGGTLVTIQRPVGNSYKDEQTSENSDKDVVKDVVKEHKIELTERQTHIIGLFPLYPTMSVAELTEKKCRGKILIRHAPSSATSPTFRTTTSSSAKVVAKKADG